MSAAAIRTRVWRHGVLEHEDFPFEQVSDYAAEPDTLVWADLVDPTPAFVHQIAEELELDPHAVEDALAERERPKAMRYPTHLFLTTYTVTARDGELRVGRMSAFSTKHVLVTVRFGDCIDIETVVARWDDEPQLMKYGPRALVHGLLDEIVDRYMDAAQMIDDRTEALEDILFSEESGAGREVSKRCYELRRTLVRLRRAIVPMRDVVGTVTRNTSHDEQAELIPYYDDLYDHTLRVTEWTDGLRDTITSIFETNMSLADTRMNTIMKKLTSWAAIIAVPTAVTGFYGQNVPYPGFGHTWGFWVSIAAIVLIAAALYVTFRRKDWL